MCGIAGIMNFSEKPVSETQIEKMIEIIAHRGPDGKGMWVDGSVGFGHRRLSIIDLSNAGRQPMMTKDGRFIISYNGEIYNFIELRKELNLLGIQFFSNTDTEVVLNSFAMWGAKCVNKFNGMFAFSIWDKKKQELFMARDRYGIKPLYFFHDIKRFIFASEIKAIIKSEYYMPSLDFEGVVEYLTFQNFFTDKTLFKNIRLVKPGHYVIIDRSGSIQYEKYWDFEFNNEIKLSEKDVVEETDRLFNQAVQRQLISDVPVNSYLSGGIDSGAISMVAGNHLDNLKTFTIGFDLSSVNGIELSFDERKKAEHISSLAKTEHYEMVLKAGDMERCIENYVWHLEEPRVGQSYPYYYAANLASKFGKVVLSGCGGDEIFAGYPWRYFNTDKRINFDKFIDAYYLSWQRLFSNSDLKKLLSPIEKEIKGVWTKDIFANIFEPIKQKAFSPEECINASLYLEAKTFLHGLLVVEDKISMAHSLETRVPFLDNDLVDFSMKIPTSLKLSQPANIPSESDLFSKKIARKKGKLLLRKVLARYLGEEITNAKKQGFSSPDSTWFKGESINFVKKNFESHDLGFDQKVINDVLDEHINGKKNNRLAIWSLLYLNFFKESFLS